MQEDPRNAKLSEELRIFKQSEQDYISWLETMMFFLSHRVRQPLTQVLGLSGMLDAGNALPGQQSKVAGLLKQSALSVDKQVKELSRIIYDKINRLKEIGLQKP